MGEVVFFLDDIRRRIELNPALGSKVSCLTVGLCCCIGSCDSSCNLELLDSTIDGARVWACSGKGNGEFWTGGVGACC